MQVAYALDVARGSAQPLNLAQRHVAVHDVEAAGNLGEWWADNNPLSSYWARRSHVELVVSAVLKTKSENRHHSPLAIRT